MTATFAIDLNQNTLKFGDIADGQITDLAGKLNISSKSGEMPYSGTIEGQFIGDIKGRKTLPLTFPHKAEDAAGYNIVVIGAGGTGGYVIRDLVRFIYSLKENGDARAFSIKLVDGDQVEAKNVKRQNFSPRDVGKYKAEVLAKRYAGPFGLEIEALTEMANNQNLDTILNESVVSNPPPGGRRGNQTNIVLGCVDNNAARRTIQEVVTRKARTYWIDSGNEKKSGQVVCGFGRVATQYRDPEKNSSFPLKNVCDLYPEILDPGEDDTTEEDSCAERAVQDSQNIFVNMTAAGHVLSYIRQIVSGEKITINSLEYNIKGVTSPNYITEGYVRENLCKQRR